MVIARWFRNGFIVDLKAHSLAVIVPDDFKLKIYPPSMLDLTDVMIKRSGTSARVAVWDGKDFSFLDATYPIDTVSVAINIARVSSSGLAMALVPSGPMSDTGFEPARLLRFSRHTNGVGPGTAAAAPA